MAEARAALNWERDGADWPNRGSSRFTNAAGLRWHVQQFGEGPACLLVHGTGASTHSWTWLAPHLAKHFTLTMIDLPGHAFTTALPGSKTNLPGMSSAIGELVQTLNLAPEYAVGHSAGAAILAHMVLGGKFAPKSLISINGALTPFPGMAGQIFPAMAKVLFLNPFTPRLFAWRATQSGTVERLIDGTGSSPPAHSLELYRRLFASPNHVTGALSMLANWDLAGLNRDLPKLDCPLMQIVGSNDRAVPPDQAFQLAARIPRSRTELLRGLGHLAHEEDGERVAACILKTAATQEVAEGIA